MLLISGPMLRKLIPMSDAVEVVRGAFRKVSAGEIEQPTRVSLAGGGALAMLASERLSSDTVVKAVTVRDRSATGGLPAVQAVVLLFEGPTGRPVAVIDGTTLTALRTGAASGVATDCLAAPGASVLAVIGSGGQSSDQIRAVCAVRPIRDVRISSRSIKHSEALAERLRNEFPRIDFVALDSNADAVADADVVCTATTATMPLFAATALARNAHVNAIGAYTPAMCEIPPELLGEARVVAVDQIAAAMAEAGDLIQAIASGHLSLDRISELGHVLSDQPRPVSGWSVFKSVGIAAQDLELARLALRRAREAATSIPQFS